MKRLIIFFLISVVFCGCGEAAVRAPAVSGGFYPASPAKLQREVDEFMDEAGAVEAPGRIIALVVPHAGYMYSGRTAGYAYKEIRNKKFDTVILIGPSHRERFSGIAVADYDAFQTPLGKIEIDKSMVKALIKSNRQIRAYNSPHVYEHCLEVQLPFLQQALGKFKMVALLIGESSIRASSALGKAIAENAKGKNVLIIAFITF